MDSGGRLEGSLLKQGRKVKTSWKRRFFKQADDNFLLFSKGEHIKGSLDLSSMRGVHVVEEILMLEKNQYFLFEIQMKDGDNLLFGASDRLQLDYWLEGLRAILVKNGATVQKSIGEIIESASCNISPIYYPGEKLTFFLASTTLVFDSGNTHVANCFLTNYKIHLCESSINSTNPDALYAPDSHGLRVTIHSIPVTSIHRIDKFDEKDFFGVDIVCRDIRRVKLRWGTKELRNQLLYWANLYSPARLNETFAYTFSKFFEPTHQYKLNAWGYLRYDAKAEFARLGVPNANWRISDANTDYQMIPTYPAYLAIPAIVSDSGFRKICSFRTRKRAPILSYHHTNGAALLRSSQPKRGVTGNSAKDESYLDILGSLSCIGGFDEQAKKAKQRLWVYDARSLAAAQANRAIGGGFEDYKGSKVIFCDIENIHVVRDSFNALCKLCTSCEDESWHAKLNETGWLVHEWRILSSAEKIAGKLEEGQVVLVHCSDGWDRTAQLTGVVSILLDPFYRTIEGFELLIEKEWLSFGHQFQLRLGYMDGLGKESSEVSPIFLQFLECVWHITQLYPTAFEFNSDFLVAIFDHLNSCHFGTFLCNSEQQRVEGNIFTETSSLWAFLDTRLQFYRNPFWKSSKQKILRPNFEMRHMTVWRQLWFRYDEQEATSMILSGMQYRLVAAAVAEKSPPGEIFVQSPRGNHLINIPSIPPIPQKPSLMHTTTLNPNTQTQTSPPTSPTSGGTQLSRDSRFGFLSRRAMTTTENKDLDDPRRRTADDAAPRKNPFIKKKEENEVTNSPIHTNPRPLTESGPSKRLPVTPRTRGTGEETLEKKVSSGVISRPSLVNSATTNSASPSSPPSRPTRPAGPPGGPPGANK